MTKDELIEALRETGIVTKKNDANGIRILLTQNDLETIQEKRTAARRRRRLELAQTTGIVVTAACLIVTTIWGIVREKEEKATYIPRSGYIVKIRGNTQCLLIEKITPDFVEAMKEKTGIPACESQ